MNNRPVGGRISETQFHSIDMIIININDINSFVTQGPPGGRVGAICPRLAAILYLIFNTIQQVSVVFETEIPEIPLPQAP
jgi:hypothetical protein